MYIFLQLQLLFSTILQLHREQFLDIGEEQKKGDKHLSLPSKDWFSPTLKIERVTDVGSYLLFIFHIKGDMGSYTNNLV